MVFGEFEKLVEKGFPQKAFFNLVLKTKEDLFYFGGICVSEGDRIIYFPGTTNNTIKDTPARKYIGERLDHLTLEKDLRQWHITLEGGRHIQERIRTREIGENGLLYWFSLNLRSLEELDRFGKNGGTHRITRTFTGIPPTDSIRRTNILSKTLKSGKGVVLIPKCLQDKPFDCHNKFFHFSFLIDTQPKLVKKINFINPPIDCKTKEICSAHRVEMKDAIDLMIVCAYLDGTIAHQALYNWA